jgi:trans-2,3-dihydro-3-hydroxyanthranilate isomerase
MWWWAEPWGSPPVAAIARALTLPQDAITECWYAGVGLRFCFVRLADRDLVDRAVPDKGAWTAGMTGTWSPELYLFAGDHRDGVPLHARFFAPRVGADEDPATGSACASLIASLAHRSPERDSTYRIQINQGIRAGAP